jgi:hypothetical protein
MYLLFCGDSYYPTGGWNDFKGSYKTLEEAINSSNDDNDWWHVVSTETWEIMMDKYRFKP